jgi:hypothetical protein
MLAVHYTIGNIYDQYRSSVSQLQLVLLCKDADFKYFGAAVIFRQLLVDLQDLELNDLSLPSGQIMKGSAVAITGDNLGSHGIGGFVENFSTCDYICRYCDCSRSVWSANGNVQGIFRAKDSYNASVQLLNENPLCKEHNGIRAVNF